MPRSYKMSADTSEKEKIIGGILTAAQGGWLGGGFVISASLLMLLTHGASLPAPVALLFALPPGMAFGLTFAFYKKKELTLWQYITLKYRFKKKEKILLNTLCYQKKFEGKDFDS